MSSDDSFKEDNKGQLETGDFALDVEFFGGRFSIL